MAYTYCAILYIKIREREMIFTFFAKSTIGKIVSEMNKNGDLPGVDRNSVRDGDSGTTSECFYFFL